MMTCTTQAKQNTTITYNIAATYTIEKNMVIGTTQAKANTTITYNIAATYTIK